LIKKLITSFLIILVVFAGVYSFNHRHRDFVRIPIEFLPIGGQSCIAMEIDGNRFLVQLDSGGTGLSLAKQVLEKIPNKIQDGVSVHYNFRGKEYTKSRYVVHSVQIGKNITFQDYPVSEESYDLIAYGTRISSSDVPKISASRKDFLAKVSGRIGSKFLRSLNYCLIDFKNSAFYALPDSESIKNNPLFSLEGFTEVPIESNQPHIVISVETDLGIKKFLLDTGATISFLRFPPSDPQLKHQFFTSKKFNVNGTDFGATDFLFVELTPEAHFDGALGRDFFNKHAVYLDFKNNRALIGPTLENQSTEVRTPPKRTGKNPNRLAEEKPT
jgi:hypothetical protein